MKAVYDKKDHILALGAESEGIFAVYKNGNIFISKNFGDLLDEDNFSKYKKAVLNYLKKEKFKSNVILTDLHPLYKTTKFGEELAKKYNAYHIKVQHHIAHIFSAVGDKILTFCHSESASRRMRNLSRMRGIAHSCEIFRFAQNDRIIISDTFFGIAMDGTGYGMDGNIWGGEIFKITNYKLQITKQFQNQNFKTNIKKSNLSVERIGSLEEQIMIGGDLAVREPARMVIAILAKLKTTTNNLKIKNHKTFIYSYVKRYYNKNEFEALYNQMEQNFNCQKTSSTGRILDAVSVLLGFAGNERKYKHEATKILEKCSTIPYDDCDLHFDNREKLNVLNTTYLFRYLIKNLKRDKKRLAATAQLYLAEGLCEIAKKQISSNKVQTIFCAGGMANNKIISSYLEKQGVYLSKKIPRGDEGIAFGQIIYYLTNSRH